VEKMKKIVFILIVFIGFIGFSVAKSQLSSQVYESINSNNFYEIQKGFNQYFESKENKSGWKQFKRWEYFWAPRVSPSGEVPSAINILNDWNKYQQKNRDNSTLSVKWKLLGPIDNPPSAGSTRKQGLGRVNRIRFAPNDTNVFWAASASGGVWKTIDGGKN
jgi:hypothetical protein